MKNILILILFFSLILPSVAQKQTVNLATDYTLSSDTVFSLRTSANYTWGMCISWDTIQAGRDATFTVVTKQMKNDSWSDYSGSLTYTMSGSSDSTGVKCFEDFMSTLNYIGLKVEPNTSTGGKININVTIVKNE